MSETTTEIADLSKLDEPLPGYVRDALLAWLKVDGGSSYESDRLHYGADLWPGVCERKVFYGIRGTKRDEESLGSQLRFKGGRVFEALLAAALEHAGLDVKTQVLVRPLRPSAWAWSPGRADVVVQNWRKLIEVKAPRAALFERAKDDPRKLVKEQYRWQLSAYFHELKRRGLVDRASWIFLDREGAHEPVEVELEGELLVPIEKIVEQEERRARLVTASELPARVEGSTVVEVLKGRSRKKPERVVRATARRNWQCTYCSFSSTCQPGPEEEPVELEPAKRAETIAEAERQWAAGAKKVVLTYGAVDEEELPPAQAAEEAETVSAEESAAAPEPAAASLTPTPAAAPGPSASPNGRALHLRQEGDKLVPMDDGERFYEPEEYARLAKEKGVTAELPAAPSETIW